MDYQSSLELKEIKMQHKTMIDFQCIKHFSLKQLETIAEAGCQVLWEDLRIEAIHSSDFNLGN